jgi:hypothetical protein
MFVEKDQVFGTRINADVKQDSITAGKFQGLILPAGLKSRIKRHGAVHEKADAGHIVGVVGCQPDSGPGNILRLSDTLVSITAPSGLLNEFGHQARPARLMAGTQPGAVVTVKVLVKQQVIPPVGVILEYTLAAVNWPLLVAVTQKQVDQAAGQFGGDLTEIQHPA